MVSLNEIDVIQVHYFFKFWEPRINKLAWQSFTFPHSYVPTADKAVDGNPASNFHNKSCTHTKVEDKPWWTVDLGAEYLVSEVVITNRGDSFGIYLYGFLISMVFFFCKKEM